MSMASPTRRSSSSTLPGPSFNRLATDRLALPSTAEMWTGTSKTGARSAAVLSSVISEPVGTRAVSGANSSRGGGVSRARGGVGERLLHPRRVVGSGVHQEPRGGLDLQRQGVERGPGGRLGRLVQRGVGDLAGGDHGELGRAGLVLVGEAGQARQ